MRSRPPRPRNDEERILPLINAVFLLLIFFMIAGHLSASDPFPVELPNSQSEALPEAQRLTVLMSSDGALAVDGETIIEPAALEAVFAARLEQNPAVRTQLKADGGTDATRVVAVMERLRKAGVERLQLLTIPKVRKQ